MAHLVRKATAMAKSAEESRELSDHVKSCDWLQSLEEAPIFRPTLDEFKDPLAYIQSIAHSSACAGICKIVPPVPATTSFMTALKASTGYQYPDRGRDTYKFPTRQQVIRDIPWDDLSRTRFWTAPQPRTLAKFQTMADQIATKVFKTTVLMPSNMVEMEFWRQMAIPMKNDEKADLTVEYGDNVEGSGFGSSSDDPLGSSQWNFNVLPTLPKSTLRLLKGSIPGITAPMLYIGMLFSTFCWHIEDLYLYSINYHHAGCPKTWYGISPEDADRFEEVALKEACRQATCYQHCANCASPEHTVVYAAGLAASSAVNGSDEATQKLGLQTLLQKTTMFSPARLVAAGIRVTRCIQHAGEFVLTFPRAYHGGFSNGHNIGEAVNFALRDWFCFGADCALRMRHFNQVQAVPLEQLTCVDMAALHTDLSKRALAAAVAPAAHPDGTISPSAALREWLKTNAPSAVSERERPLVVTFCQLLRWHNSRLHALVHSGAQLLTQPLDNCIPCTHCKDMCYLTYVMVPNASAEATCLRCWEQMHAPESDGCTPSAAQPPRPSDLVIFVSHKLDAYCAMAQMYAGLCQELGWGSLDPDMWRGRGLTDRLNLPNAEGDYVREDLTQEYKWRVIRAPRGSPKDVHAAWLLQPLERNVQTVLESLLPPAASDEPFAAPTPAKGGAGRGTKRNNAGKALLGGKQSAKALRGAGGLRHSPSGQLGKGAASKGHNSGSMNQSQEAAEVEESVHNDSTPLAKRRGTRAAKDRAVAAAASQLSDDYEPPKPQEKRRKKEPASKVKQPETDNHGEASSNGTIATSMKASVQNSRLPPVFDQDAPSTTSQQASQGLAATGRASLLSGLQAQQQKQAFSSGPSGPIPSRASEGDMQTFAMDPFLQQLRVSSRLNDEVNLMLQYLSSLPPVAQVYPTRPHVYPDTGPQQPRSQMHSGGSSGNSLARAHNAMQDMLGPNTSPGQHGSFAAKGHSSRQDGDPMGAGWGRPDGRGQSASLPQNGHPDRLAASAAMSMGMRQIGMSPGSQGHQDVDHNGSRTISTGSEPVQLRTSAAASKHQKQQHMQQQQHPAKNGIHGDGAFNLASPSLGQSLHHGGHLDSLNGSLQFPDAALDRSSSLNLLSLNPNFDNDMLGSDALPGNFMDFVSMLDGNDPAGSHLFGDGS